MACSARYQWAAKLPAHLHERFRSDGFPGPINLLTPDEVANVRVAVADVIGSLDRYRDRLYEVEQSFTERPGEIAYHFLGGRDGPRSRRVGCRSCLRGGLRTL